MRLILSKKIGHHPIHRSILDHWLWKKKPFAYGQAWLDLILLANHADSKIIIKSQLVYVKRGQVCRAKKTLAKRWGWTRNRVQRFLKILENDTMVTFKSGHLTTVITLLNYNSLHKECFSGDASNDTSDGHLTDIRRTHTKNDKECIKNKRKDIVVQILSDLNEKAKTSYKAETTITTKLINNLITKGYSLDDFKVVHKRKCEQWLQDPKMRKFVRPQTLYAESNFEAYLNEVDLQSDDDMLDEIMG